jgi:hypothetical protein
MRPWVRPHSGGTKIPKSLKEPTKRRIVTQAEKHYAGRYARGEIRLNEVTPLADDLKALRDDVNSTGSRGPKFSDAAPRPRMELRAFCSAGSLLREKLACEAHVMEAEDGTGNALAHDLASERLLRPPFVTHGVAQSAKAIERTAKAVAHLAVQAYWRAPSAALRSVGGCTSPRRS